MIISTLPGAYWQVLRFRNMTLLIVGGLLLGVSAIAYRLGVLIVRPLERLTKGAAEATRPGMPRVTRRQCSGPWPS